MVRHEEKLHKRGTAVGVLDSGFLPPKKSQDTNEPIRKITQQNRILQGGFAGSSSDAQNVSSVVARRMEIRRAAKS